MDVGASGVTGVRPVHAIAQPFLSASCLGGLPCSQVLAGARRAIESPGRSVRSRARGVAAASAAAERDGSTRCSTDTPTHTRSCLWRGVRSSVLGHRRDGAAPPPHIARGVVLGGVPGHDAHAGDVRSESTSARHPHTATQKGGAESDWARTPLSRDGFPTPNAACVRATSVSRDREQTFNRDDHDRAPQEEHEVRDDPGHPLPDVWDRSDSAGRYDQRDRR